MSIDWQRLKPKYWFQNTQTCWEWDKTLNQLLDTYQVQRDGPCHALLGKAQIWVANYPYAYGKLKNFGDESLPSVATRKRLREALHEHDRKALWELASGGGA